MPELQALARGTSHAARTVLRRGTLAAAIGLTALVGVGFIVFAAYIAMRPALGPAFSALLTGASLIGLAAATAAVCGQVTLPSKPQPPAESQHALRQGPLATLPRTAEATTMAVFTVAYVLGRRLADRRRN